MNNIKEEIFANDSSSDSLVDNKFEIEVEDYDQSNSEKSTINNKISANNDNDDSDIGEDEEFFGDEDGGYAANKNYKKAGSRRADKKTEEVADTYEDNNFVTYNPANKINPSGSTGDPLFENDKKENRSLNTVRSVPNFEIYKTTGGMTDFGADDDVSDGFNDEDLITYFYGGGEDFQYEQDSSS